MGTLTRAALPALTAALVLAAVVGAARANERVPVVVVPAWDSSPAAARDADAVARGALEAAGWSVVPSGELTASLAAFGYGPRPVAEEPAALLARLEAADQQFFALELDAARAGYAATLAALAAAPGAFAADHRGRQRLLDHNLRYVRLLRAMGAADEAAAELRDLAARMGPGIDPHPDHHPEAIVSEYRDAREVVLATAVPLEVAIVAADGRGALDECRVFVDGRDVGAGPQVTTPVPRGRRSVLVRCGGVSSVVRWVEAAAATRVLVDLGVDRALRAAADAPCELRLPGAPEARLLTAARAIADVLAFPVIAFARPGAAEPLLVRVSPAGARAIRLGPPPPPEPGPRVWTWVALGAGVAAAGTGGYYHWLANDETRRINRGEQRLGERRDALTATKTLYGVGGALVAGAVALYFVEPLWQPTVPASDDPHTVQLLPTPTGLVLHTTW